MFANGVTPDRLRVVEVAAIARGIFAKGTSEPSP
jgi:hypothetical protein